MQSNLSHEPVRSQEPSVFKFEEFNVRVMDKEDNPWFVAKDVCAVLDIKNTSDAVQGLDSDEKVTIGFTDSEGKPHKLLIVSESGLYSLVFKSKKPNAKRFSRWVRKEVLPSIRKTGSYSTKQKDPIELIIESAQLLLEQKRQMQALDNRVAIIEKRHEKVEEELRSLPEPSVNAAEKSTRSCINQKIRQHARSRDIEFRELWNMVYTEFKYRYHIDIKLRAANRGLTPLDYVDSIDMMDEFYAVTCEICR